MQVIYGSCFALVDMTTQWISNRRPGGIAQWLPVLNPQYCHSCWVHVPRSSAISHDITMVSGLCTAERVRAAHHRTCPLVIFLQISNRCTLYQGLWLSVHALQPALWPHVSLITTCVCTVASHANHLNNSERNGAKTPGGVFEIPEL